ncbi:MAG: hypothetical protein ACYS9X_04550 [Planctomycetota bacterium]|jgi:hypothetical protein
METGSPEADSPAAEPRYRPSRLLAFGLPAVALVGIVAAVVYFEVRRRRSDRARIAVAKADIAEQLAAIRARGEPLTLAELAPPPVPDDENAAVIYEQAFAMMPAVVASEWSNPATKEWFYVLSDDEPVEPHLPKVKAVLALYAKVLPLARKAMERPRCRFDNDYSKGVEVELPHLAHLRALARVFSGEAILHASSGRDDKAAESIACVVGLARAFDEEPLLISQLVKIAIASIGIGALEKIERGAPLGDSARKRVIAEMQTLNFAEPMSVALEGERVMSYVGVGRLLSGDVDPLFAEEAREAQRNLPNTWEDHARLLKAETELIDASRLHLSEGIPRVDAVIARLDPLAPSESPVSKMLMSALRAAFVRVGRATAIRDTAILGLSCEIFRSAEGRYPAKLDELAPEFVKELPPDPFTGKPLKYELRDDGAAFIVYSVGDNLKDDGGVNDRSDKDDISWEGRAPTGGAERPAAGTRGE